jgi:ParB/RepB/Spo0J family partition protein
MKDERLIEIPIDLIKKLDNSRLRIEERDLVPLMEDIKHRGLLQPIGIIQEGSEYIITFGNRRLEACKKLGWKTIPAILRNRELNEDSFMADNVAENTHRVDLTPIEFANVCQGYLNKGYNISETASVLGESIQKIKNALAISERTPEEFRMAISYIKGNAEKRNKKGKISVAVANQIFTPFLKKEYQEKLLNEAKKNELSAEQINLIKSLLGSGCSFNKALEHYKDYKICSCSMPLNKKELEKYGGMSMVKLISGFISGEIPNNKKLLVN